MSDLPSFLVALATSAYPSRKELAEALRECIDKYCPGCGFGEEGCATIHHRNCRFLALLEKAEGRKLKLNGEPVEEESYDATSR